MANLFKWGGGVAEKKTDLITFKIKYKDIFEITLTADRGMTFGEWINSEYNTIGAYAKGVVVCFFLYEINDDVYIWPALADGVYYQGTTNAEIIDGLEYPTNTVRPSIAPI